MATGTAVATVLDRARDGNSIKQHEGCFRMHIDGVLDGVSGASNMGLRRLDKIEVSLWPHIHSMIE